MNRRMSGLVLLIVLTALAAGCSRQLEPAQVVRVEVTEKGFQPDRLEAVEGQPLRLVFVRTTDSGCAREVQSADLGIPRTELPKDREVEIEVVPQKSGEFVFACGMDMLKGTVVVRPSSG